MTKILFLSHGSELFGAERSLLDLLKGLNREKYEPLVFLPNKGPLKKELEKLKIPLIIYPLRRWIPFTCEFSLRHLIQLVGGLPRRIRFICRLIDKEKIDLVYTNTITLIDGAIAAKIKGLAHIYHIHNVLYRTYFRPYLPKTIIFFLVNFLSSRMIFLTDIQRKCMNFGGNRIGKGRIDIIPYGFDTKEFTTGNFKEKIETLGLPLKASDGAKVILSIGAFVEHKGHSDFIRAAQIVSRHFPQTLFVLTGNIESPFLGNLQKMVRDFQLEGIFHFLGSQSDMPPLYHLADVFVSASHNETFGRCIVEAMIAGKPVVSTRCGGPEEIVLDGETGFLVPVASVQDLAQAIIKLIAGPQLAQRMGRLGQERARQLYSLERYVAQIEDIVEQCLEHKYRT